MTTTAEMNKALVLEAFDTLFIKRDYEAAKRYWSPNYIQHSAHIEPGREGLFNLIKGSPASLKYEPGLIMAEGGLCHHPWAILWHWTPKKLDRRRRLAHRRRGVGRTLGRPPG